MSHSIITSLFWVKKDWAKKVPIEYDFEEIEKDEKMQKIKKVTNNLKNKGKLTGNETIKQTTEIVSENMDIDDNEEGNNVLTFCEDLKTFYTKDNNETEDKELEKYPEGFDEISEEDDNDFTIHPSDSIIVCGTAEEDYSNLEVNVYIPESSRLYVHHDITLSSQPLVLEWLPYKNNQKANYALVGSFMPEIEIWNLDILNVIQPELILGHNSTNNNLAHTDAVIGINLNPINPNIVVSSGADNKILFWDLNTSPQQASMSYLEHTDKVQTVKFNKNEDNILASGAYDKTIKLYDCRQKTSSATIKINSDIECLEWSPKNKYYFLVSFENGTIDLFDIRKFESIFTFQAHKKECTAVTFSNNIDSLFVSVGRDCRIKVWDGNTITKDIDGNTTPELVMEKFIKKSTGELFACKFADDVDYTIAAGGSKGELYIWELDESPIFCSKYGLKYEGDDDIPDKYNNLTKKKKLSYKK